MRWAYYRVGENKPDQVANTVFAHNFEKSTGVSRVRAFISRYYFKKVVIY